MPMHYITVRFAVKADSTLQAEGDIIDWLDQSINDPEDDDEQGYTIVSAVAVEQPMDQFVTFASSWMQGARFLMERNGPNQTYCTTLYPADAAAVAASLRLQGAI